MAMCVFICFQLEPDNARVNRATSKGANLRVERMVKLAKANHPRNEPTPTRDVASVQRIVIQTVGRPATDILATPRIEVEHVRIRSVIESFTWRGYCTPSEVREM